MSRDKKPCRTPLGRMLRLYMAHHEITVRELSAELGIPNQSTVTRLCQGLNPDIDTWLKVQAWLLKQADESAAPEAGLESGDGQ